MGYRELLKKYIRYLEIYEGDNFIENIPEAREQLFSKRDFGELRTIAAEVFREGSLDDGFSRRLRNNNYRFRLLMNRYGLSVEQAAALLRTAEAQVQRWRTHPRSERYVEMSDSDFSTFEERLAAWLDGADDGVDDK